MSDEERKRARLQQDLSGEDDLDSLLEVGRFLNQWSSPPADPAKMAQLMAQITEETAPFRRDVQLNVPTNTIIQTRFACLRTYSRLTITLLRAQIRIVRSAIWLASALVMVLGLLVNVINYSPTMGTTVLMMVMPLVAALGIAFIYGEDIDPPTELLMSTPISPRLVLIARMALVFGFDLTLGLLASLAASLTTPDLSFMPLVMTWLAPMTFLSMLALLMSVIFNDPLASVLVSLGIWVTLCIGHLSAVGVPSFVPDLLSDTNMRIAFWVLSLTMGILALWVAGREEHLLGRMKS